MNDLVEYTPEIVAFVRSPILRQKLQALLADNTLKVALDALATLSMPRAIPKAIPNNHPDTAIAHSFYHMIGVAKALNMLKLMALEPAKHPGAGGDEEEAFAHALPKDLQEKPSTLKTSKP